MSTPTIKPTVGRVVWFYPDPRVGSTDFHPPTLNDPLAAIVAKVIGERMLNLTVFDANGMPHSRPSVPLVQEGDDPVDGDYATWMPYQIGQAKKHADEPKAAASASCAGQIIGGGSGLYGNLRYQVLEMALRTPGLAGHEDVLQAAAAYQAHIEGEKTVPAAQQLVTGADAIAALDDTGDVSPFVSDLAAAINRHSKENGSNTPDFILASFLGDCLSALDRAVQRRREWHAPEPAVDPSGLPQAGQTYAALQRIATESPGIAQRVISERQAAVGGSQESVHKG